MIPRLFSIGPFTVYSYGLMLGIAFICASWLFNKELERRKMDTNLSTEITLLAIIFGIAGSKILYLIENWSEFSAAPLSSAFSPGGLTFYGGFILATVSIYVWVRRKKIPFLRVADSVSPSLALAYGIGRIGCHLAGDGDYGLPTSLPWGVNYENGTVPPSFAFRGTEYARHFPGGILPDSTPLHPTPLYEFLMACVIAFVLWRLLRKNWADGKVFMFYLIMTGVARFFIEFIRINPEFILGLSEAQVISALLVASGALGVAYYSRSAQNKEK
jgi:phosphatidylglycerol:prolipoprotein diacylglycerol transferase